MILNAQHIPQLSQTRAEQRTFDLVLNTASLEAEIVRWEDYHLECVEFENHADISNFEQTETALVVLPPLFLCMWCSCPHKRILRSHLTTEQYK